MSKETAQYIKSIREITGLTQQAFGERYGISKRTIEEWEVGRRISQDYVWALLERAVRQDYGQPWKFFVVRTDGKSDQILLETYNRFTAIQLARTVSEQLNRNSLSGFVEIRLYGSDGKYELLDFATHKRFRYYINGIEEQETIFMGMLNPSDKQIEKLKDGELLTKNGNVFKIISEEI